MSDSTWNNESKNKFQYINYVKETKKLQELYLFICTSTDAYIHWKRHDTLSCGVLFPAHSQWKLSSNYVPLPRLLSFHNSHCLVGQGKEIDHEEICHVLPRGNIEAATENCDENWAHSEAFPNFLEIPESAVSKDAHHFEPAGNVLGKKRVGLGVSYFFQVWLKNCGKNTLMDPEKNDDALKEKEIPQYFIIIVVVALFLDKKILKKLHPCGEMKFFYSR